MLDFRLDTFLAVCKHLNFTRAAKELNITQPAVSQHIRYLQELYQVKLFKHIGKKIELTKEGQYLQNIAMTLKHDDIFLKEKLTNKTKQKLSFGTTLTVGHYLLLDTLVEYIKCNPNISLSMYILNTKQLLHKINTGKIDFAMVEGYFSRTEFDYLVYSKEQYIAIASNNCMIEDKQYTIEELFEQRIIVREPGSGSGDILERYLLERNYTLSEFKDVMVINNIQAMLAFVEADCGISFVYKKAVEKELQEGKIKEISIKDFDIQHDISLVWRKNSIFAPMYKELFEIFTDNRGDKND